MAMMWIARFNVRLPLGLRRCRLRSPDDASIGAVALWAAKWSRLGNRSMFRTLRVFDQLHRQLPFGHIGSVLERTITKPDREQARTNPATNGSNKKPELSGLVS